MFLSQELSAPQVASVSALVPLPFNKPIPEAAHPCYTNYIPPSSSLPLSLHIVMTRGGILTAVQRGGPEGTVRNTNKADKVRS